jgi:hypothetical protein
MVRLRVEAVYGTVFLSAGCCFQQCFGVRQMSEVCPLQVMVPLQSVSIPR